MKSLCEGEGESGGGGERERVWKGRESENGGRGRRMYGKRGEF